MSILYCLNPECSHQQNLTHYSSCQGCGGNLIHTRQSYSFHSRYLIVGVLGEGAFGRTYQAKDLNFNPDRGTSELENLPTQASGFSR